MDGLILGLDLCDGYTQMVCDQEERTWTLPTVVCKKKNEDQWLVGEAAFAAALTGDGVMVDKLVKLVMKDGTATIGGIKYGGMQLMAQFLLKVLALAREEYQTDQVKRLLISAPKVDARLLECLQRCADYLGIPKDKVSLISHTESFMYYVLSQKREVWNNQIGLFDLSADNLLCYYEMKVQRGMRQTTVVAEREQMEESFSLDIIKTPPGAKLADKILCSCAGRLLQKKTFSSVFLTGKGFEDLGWAEEFMKLVCARRRVYGESALFAKGAVYRAADLTREKTAYPYVCVCEGRLDSNVTMRVLHKDQENQLVLASAGETWHEAGKEVELILDHQDYLEFIITALDPKKKKTVKLVLEGFPKRDDKTLKVLLKVGFLDERTMTVAVKDQGFGDFFPSTGACVRQEVML